MDYLSAGKPPEKVFNSLPLVPAEQAGQPKVDGIFEVAVLANKLGGSGLQQEQQVKG